MFYRMTVAANFFTICSRVKTLLCAYKYFLRFWDNAVYWKHLRTVLDNLKLSNFLEKINKQGQFRKNLTKKGSLLPLRLKKQAKFVFLQLAILGGLF